MLNIFKSDQHAKAYKALLANDLEKFAKSLQKIDADKIDLPVSDNTPSLAECCILEQNPKALQSVIDKGANPNKKSLNQPEYHLAELTLLQEQSLPLLTVLLKAIPKTSNSDLLLKCFQLKQDSTLMLHLSLLLQNGAELNDEVVHLALLSEDLPLIHFIINSGANQPSMLAEQGYSEEVIAYAQRCWNDLKIREMFL